MKRHPDGGQATVLVAAAMVVAILVAAGAARVGSWVVRDARAQAAADAAALAGVDGGRRAAHDLAAVNGAQLVSWDESSGVVTVVVRIDDTTATARASAMP